MSKTKKSLDIGSAKQKLSSIKSSVQKYTPVLFIVLVLALYGLVLTKLHTLRNAQPSESSISDQVKAAKIPHIDEKVVHQLRSLHDNSVSVKSLFDGERSNPFKE